MPRVPLLVIALVVAACSTSQSESGAVATDAQSEPTVPAASSPGGLASIESPVAELFGLPIGDADAMEEQFSQLGVDAEREIGVCMRARGFDYTAIGYVGVVELDDAISADGRAFAEQYGFGISANLDGWLEESAEGFTDPNAPYVESLSDAERDAYWIALVGGPVFVGPDDESSSFAPGGCQGEAYEAAFGQLGLFDEFGDELAGLQQAIEGDQRIVDADDRWAACMAEAGYGYPSPGAARQHFERQYHSIFEHELPVQPLGIEAGDDAEGVVVIGDGLVYSAEVQAMVDELAAEERAAAIATWDCEQPLRSIYAEVRIEHELRFVEEHGDEVRAAVSAE